MPQAVDTFAQITNSASAGKVLLQAEALIRSDSQASLEEVCAAAESWLRTLSKIPAISGPLFPQDQAQGNPFLDAHCESISLVDVEYSIPNGPSKPFFLPWEVIFDVRAYALTSDGAEDGDDGDDDCPSFRQYTLPSTDFHGLWESLYYDTEVKRRLLRYADSALLFGQLGVDNTLITSGRLVLLHGPPGTGKTSLCKALAQKLSIRLNKNYNTAELVEVNAHSLFSRWFSESGKLVAKLFEAIKEKLEEPDALVFVLVDEVESLAAARGAASGNGEPSDAIRAVNALLTQLDQLRHYKNCMILTTSNLTGNIDIAFVDRADIKAYIGPPTVKARYEMLRSSLQELVKVGIINFNQDWVHFPRLDDLPAAASGIVSLTLDDNNTNYNKYMADSLQSAHDESVLLGLKLGRIAENADGLSGRALRKLPFLAHAGAGFPGGRATADQFLDAMDTALNEEKNDREALVQTS